MKLHAAGPAARPFKGSVAGEATWPADTTCPVVGLRTHSEATGTATHLGRTTMTSDHCTPAGDDFGPGEMTLTGANGDRIHIVYSGSAPSL